MLKNTKSDQAAGPSDQAAGPSVCPSDQAAGLSVGPFAGPSDQAAGPSACPSYQSEDEYEHLQGQPYQAPEKYMGPPEGCLW